MESEQKLSRWYLHFLISTSIIITCGIFYCMPFVLSKIATGLHPGQIPFISHTYQFLILGVALFTTPYWLISFFGYMDE